MNSNPFNLLNLNDTIVKSLSDNGYIEPTEIQSKAIPLILENNDIIACAQTGTGKSAAFCLPMLQKLDNQKKQYGFEGIRGLILAPTRELAVQINNSLDKYGSATSLNNTAIFGGIPRKVQIDYLSREIDILVATPGRLLDLVERGIVDLSTISMFVLDEADSMLSLGFIDDVKKVIDILPKTRQNLLFSATMPQEIEELAQSFLNKPLRIRTQNKIQTSTNITQKLYYVENKDKLNLFLYLIKKSVPESCFIFVKTKKDADALSEFLINEGYKSAAIHSNLSQLERQTVLDRFKTKELNILVATDVVARGIDIDNVTLVINYDLPQELDTYLHRIGRTGRASSQGISLTLTDPSEYLKICKIESLIKHKIQVIENHPYINLSIHKKLFEQQNNKINKGKKTKKKKSR